MRNKHKITLKINLLVILFLTIITIDCTSYDKSKEFDYGQVENNKYINSFFDFEITLPPDWVVQTKEQTEHLTQKGLDLVAGDDKNMKAILKASEINSANLLSIFKYEVGAAVEYNPNFMLVVENLKSFPGIKTGSDYLFQTKKLLNQSQIQYDYIDAEFKKEVINNQEFYLMNASINLMKLDINQVYYSTIQNGFCISVIISFVNEEQKKELDKVINSMKFN